ncbi:MAG: methyltransferase domain-containing protein [Elusimicrobia bacterium]|nr:methyltransferase domain-containing protein [Elusimicrobiota bacterium]
MNLLKNTKRDLSNICPPVVSDREGLDRLAQLGMGFRGFRALTLAIELEIFDSLEMAHGRLEFLSQKLCLLPHHLSQLLDVLVALGFLTKKANIYRHTQFSRNWFRKVGSKSMARNLKFQSFLVQAYADLPKTFKRGRPTQSLGRLLSRRKDFLTDYIAGMAEIAKGPSIVLAKSIDLRGVRQILDVGGGHGLFSLALLKKKSTLHADILDFPSTLEMTKKFIPSRRYKGRVSFLKGDYRSTPFRRRYYDLILFSHVLHDEDPSTILLLLKKARAALAPTGKILIHDFFTNEEGLTPLFSLLLGFQLASYTTAGRCYSVKDLRFWLRETGFKSLWVKTINANLPSATMAILARED